MRYFPSADQERKNRSPEPFEYGRARAPLVVKLPERACELVRSKVVNGWGCSTSTLSASRIGLSAADRGKEGLALLRADAAAQARLDSHAPSARNRAMQTAYPSTITKLDPRSGLYDPNAPPRAGSSRPLPSRPGFGATNPSQAKSWTAEYARTRSQKTANTNRSHECHIDF